VLTRARAAAERQRNEGEGRHEGAGERGGKGVVRAGGALHPFIGSEVAPGRGGWGG
jgi:hypothetical protein